MGRNLGKRKGKMGYPRSAPMRLCAAGDLCLGPAPPGHLSDLKFLCHKEGLAQKIQELPSLKIPTPVLSAFVIREKFSSVLNGY